MKKTIAAGILSGMMIVSGVCGFAADAPAFTDVKDSDWFAADVGYVCENGLMKGVSETRFDPQGTFTRGMLVTVLHRGGEDLPAGRHRILLRPPGSLREPEGDRVRRYAAAVAESAGLLLAECRGL